MLNQIPILLPLFAALVIGTISYIQKDSLSVMANKLIITIIIFYSIGSITKKVLKSMITSNEEDQEDELDLVEDMEEEHENKNQKNLDNEEYKEEIHVNQDEDEALVD
ncbi:MAG: hypothetical protein GX347_02690 [Epulopiscium sp.]|nr:hypothetical protein [Candidatus Epulonipiscium sp.]